MDTRLIKNTLKNKQHFHLFFFLLGTWLQNVETMATTYFIKLKCGELYLFRRYKEMVLTNNFVQLRILVGRSYKTAGIPYDAIELTNILDIICKITERILTQGT